MKYLFGIVLVLIALVLGGCGLLFGQLGLDVASVLVALLAISVFMWSFLHISLHLRPASQGRSTARGPRSDEEQSAMLGEVIFQSRDDPDVG